MKLDPEKFANMVAKDVAKMLLPRVRKIVREEVDYMKERILKEIQENAPSDFVNDNSVYELQEQPVKKQKKTNQKAVVAQRKNAVQSKVKQYFGENNPYGDLIANAGEEVLEQQIAEQVREEAYASDEKIPIEEASLEEMIDPAKMDFEFLVDKVGDKNEAV